MNEWLMYGFGLWTGWDLRLMYQYIVAIGKLRRGEDPPRW